MSFFDVASVYRGASYAVGFGIGQIASLWKMSRDLSQVGCSDENLTKCLCLPLEHVQAARELMGPHDERATAVLRQAVGAIVTEGYNKTMGDHVMESITKNETTVCKALIVDPDGFNYLPVF